MTIGTLYTVPTSASHLTGIFQLIPLAQDFAFVLGAMCQGQAVKENSEEIRI